VNRLSGGRAAAPASVRECSGCGLLQGVAALEPGMTAHCGRCSTTLHRKTKHPIDHGIALAVAALVLLTVTCAAALMSVQTAGIAHSAYLLSGPSELVARGMAILAVVVVFVTVIAPYGKLLGTLYVLVRLHEKRPPAHLRRVFALAEWLRPWSMMEVFVFGVFVAYTKLGDLVTITLDTGVYALLALTIVLIWADSALDREEVWDRIGAAEGVSARAALAGPRLAEAIGCEVCALVSVPAGHDARCPRCEAHLHPRKPDSIGRTWALVIAAAALYVPANYYPVLTVVQLGAGQPSTIIGGVEELMQSGLYPLAALVFFASIAVPMMKLVGLSTMLITTQLGYGAWLRDRTRLYHAVRWIGRWSMIDIFMEALLGALVRFGSLVTIEPGIGAVAFCGVVILTMLAAETFDPRLMWDAARPKLAAATT
jgi:paraquat-inducible protein A